ncbi:Biogenesis of lysosome-related organelles complex 1 subunit 2, partial [Mucuna pruriens]
MTIKLSDSNGGLGYNCHHMETLWTRKTTLGLIVTLGCTVITTLLLQIGQIYAPTMDNMKKDEPQDQKPDELAESLDDLFSSISTMIKSELQGTNNHLELLEKMNVRVAEEYKGFGDLASGLRVFVEQLKCRSGSFNEYVEQVDNIEKQVTEFEAVVSMLDKYVALLESRVQSVYQTKIHLPNQHRDLKWESKRGQSKEYWSRDPRWNQNAFCLGKRTDLKHVLADVILSHQPLSPLMLNERIW